MQGDRSISGTLNNAFIRHALLLTFSLLCLAHSFPCRADLPDTAQIAIDKQRTAEIIDYVHKQALQGASLLPSDIRSVIGLASNGWHPMDLLDDGTQSSAHSSQLVTPIGENEPKPFDLSSNIHHKGFLPTHDAVTMGIDLKRNIVGDKLQISARPYVGQSWHSLQDYWGSEVALTVAKKPDGMPWGKLAVGYVGGNENLTDHGRGMEVHGDVDLTSGFNLTSGVRQNSTDGNSNYMMLKWKMGFE